MSAKTDPPITASDSIELHNPSDLPVDVSGWFLSDSAGDLMKYRLPDGLRLQPDEFHVFDESDFNRDPDDPQVVAEEQAGFGHERATDGDALPLTSGELGRTVVGAIGEVSEKLPSGRWSRFETRAESSSVPVSSRSIAG